MGPAHRIAVVASILALLAMACGGPPGQATGAGPESQPKPSRTLRMAVRDEAPNLAPKIPASSGPNTTRRLFNASLALIDGAGAPRPYLAEALPTLNTDSWRVFPDGRMETTYRLRDRLTWQDGTPLTAEDFVFAYSLYRDPNLGFSVNPERMMEEVLAPDSRTLVIRWRTLYAKANQIELDGLVPLPRHLLEPAAVEYAQGGTREALFGRPYWTAEFVGAGPYRLTRWEPGSHMEGEAFDGHGLGRPKIDRVLLRFMTDENTVLAAVLAGDQLDYTNTFTLRVEHLPTLRREWEALGKGVVNPFKSTALTLNVQFRPEYVGHPALLDVRVRRAIAHTLDREAVNEGVFDGQGFPTEVFVPDTEPLYALLERVRMKFPFDPQRAAQLMGEAGFARDAEGLYADASGQRYRLDLSVSAGALNERWQAILVDSWKRTGFEVSPTVLSQADQRDISTRHTFKGLASRGGGPDEAHFTAAEIGTAANRWAGDNRGGWSSPEYERLFAAFNSSLDPEERMRLSVEMWRIVNDQLVAYPLFFTIQIRTWVANLVGPDIGTAGFGLAANATTTHWNIHDWEFR